MFRPILPVQLFVTCLTLLLLTLQACSTDSGPSHPFTKGNGTEENPYWISDIDQLQAINDPEFLDKHFVQVRDIDASESSEFNDGKGFLPIGTAGNPFLGSYNGNGFKISDLNLWNIEHQNSGLFGYIKNSLIENVTLEKSFSENCGSEKSAQKAKEQYILSDQSFIIRRDELRQGAGSLVGYNDGGTIRNSMATGDFAVETPYLGGLVGYNAGLIENSNYTGHVSGLNSTGGLVGYNIGQIHNSHASGCSSASTAGGLAGFNFGQISNSSASSTLWGLRVGGLVAVHEEGIVQGCYASGETRGYGSTSGGLTAVNSAEIKDSYSLIVFSESFKADNMGGITGTNSETGIIMTSYSAVKLSSEVNSNTGGIAGLNDGLFEANYFHITASGVKSGTGSGNEDGTTGLSPSQMTGPAAQENMPEFDWVNTWATTPDGYPVLRWQVEE